MSSSLNAAAMGPMTGLARRPERKNTSCHCRDMSVWPAIDAVITLTGAGELTGRDLVSNTAIV